MRLAPSPAAVLYARGDINVLRSDETVAVIGTRKPTAGGVQVAHRLARALAESGFVIVSGLAAGIDYASHDGALAASGATVAVLGTAIDKVYPAANKPLAERIRVSGGALISEYPVGFPTSGRHFVERDRLQAAMSVAVIAIQTGVEGGTLHTVRFASEAHRPVLVPRPLASESEHAVYGGIHALIHGGSAAVIEANNDYPRLFEFIRRYRDWLLDAGSRPRPAYRPSGAAAPPDDEDVSDSDQASFEF
jgi:DNA processing protein